MDFSSCFQGFVFSYEHLCHIRIAKSLENNIVSALPWPSQSMVSHKFIQVVNCATREYVLHLFGSDSS